MDSTVRKPLQGVTNIVRFNWHFYLLFAVLLLLVFFGAGYLQHPHRLWAIVVGILASAATLITLVVSWYVYDASDLYELLWLRDADIPANANIVNINAGFDETSRLVKDMFPEATLTVIDFYDPVKHTEVSIKRARRAYPAYEGTQRISTSSLPLPDKYADVVCLTFCAHEIRDAQERKVFFQEVKRVLKPGGCVAVTEHLRDSINFMAYNIGFFHFLPASAWHTTFDEAQLTVMKQVKTTPFITTFILV